MNREASIPNLASYLDRNGRNGTLAFSQSDLTAANNQPPRIFIVEDDPIMKGMVVDYLEEHNMRSVAGCSIGAPGVSPTPAESRSH